MQAIIDMFDQRIQEIDVFFQALNELDKESVGRAADHYYYNQEFIKILKANSLIMIYNLVESSVMGAIQEIYDQVRQEGLVYADVREEIKSIWFAYKFKQVYDQQAHYQSYKAKALEIVNSILTGSVIELDRKATDVSGNLNAEKIRRVCQEHGIAFFPDSNCRGGIVLDTVKERRNDLAHGTLSFAECGRDYSITELMQIKDETISFLRSLLAGMQQYYNGKEYRLRASGS